MIVFFLARWIVARVRNQNRIFGVNVSDRPPNFPAPISRKPVSSLQVQASSSVSDNNLERISIAKIAISAPIITNVDGNDMQDYLKALENGVAHLKKTALPGEAGNSVIFGHSSYYTAKPGNYKGVFAKLDQLARGDAIQIRYDHKNYTYKVFESKIVKPEDVSVVAQDKTKEQLTLITCWPPKTVTDRMVVRASLE